jgi:hypothetical protein
MSEANEAYPPAPGSVPDWIKAEVKATWKAMQGAGQLEAYRIMERMVKRLGYGDMRDPSLAPNSPISGVSPEHGAVGE